MITKFKDWMWSRFPTYWHDNDSNKDSNGKGTAERLLEAMGLEIDEEVVDKIDSYLDNQNAQIAPDEMLQHISDAIGNPPNLFNNNNQYRNILSYIVSVYKVKGTLKGYEAFFGLLGYELTLIEYPLPLVDYDIGLQYDNVDTTNNSLMYDTSCLQCSYYAIEFWNTGDDPTNPVPLSLATLAKLRLAIDFVEPINVNLLSNTFITILSDDLNVLSVDEFLEIVLTNNNYDNSLTYDNSVIHDYTLTVTAFSGVI